MLRVAKNSPQFEVVNSSEHAQVYLAKLTRNGISVSEVIPTHIFEDDRLSDFYIEKFWLTIRKRLSSRLDLAEQSNG